MVIAQKVLSFVATSDGFCDEEIEMASERNM